MDRARSWDIVAGSALLGVLGAAAVVTAVMFAFGAWAIEGRGFGWDVGSTAMIVVAGLLVVYAAAAFLAAWAEWTDHPAGRPMGLAVAIVGALAAIVALLQAPAEQSIPLLALAVVVATLTTIVQLVPARSAHAG